MKRADPLSASELAINDCVYWLGPPSYYNRERPKVIRITDIVTSINDPEIDFFVWGDKDRDTDITNEDIKPIPLTNHRLIKNGFIKKDKVYCESGKREVYEMYVNDHKELYLIKDKTGYRVGCLIGILREFVIPIKYVHQLQNLLRCCGAFELANNFKP